ncbi:MAG: NAD(P)/FAD-dependent oxidoreductase [Clostridia bacterium]
MIRECDVIIVGAGVIGAAVARELSRFNLDICVLESMPDVCVGTSGRNSGVIHAGYNNKPGSKMAKYCVLGNRGFDALADELCVPFKRTGKLVVGFDEADRHELFKLKQTGEENGISGLEIVERDFITRKAPEVNGNFALWSPTTGITDPFALTIALAENAARNGVSFFFGCEVLAAIRGDNYFSVATSVGSFGARYIINCAGFGADDIAKIFGTHGADIYPCRGEYFVLDKKFSLSLPLPVYPVPNYKSGGLGVHLTPTIGGNILVGPSNEYAEKSCATTRDVADKLMREGARILPRLSQSQVIRSFAGLRPKLSPDGGFCDFEIRREGSVINLLGIESPGLTSAIPIAREVVELLAEVCELSANPRFDGTRTADTPFRDMTPAEREDKIRADHNYGEIVCRCEQITRGEILQAIHNDLGVHTIAGIKNRCRATMGRCQGGYCERRITELICRETGLAPEQIVYNRPASFLFKGRVR